MRSWQTKHWKNLTLCKKECIIKLCKAYKYNGDKNRERKESLYEKEKIRNGI